MMSRNEELVSFSQFGWHKGFYNNNDNKFTALYDINYTDFFEEPDDDDFPFDSAYLLLCGSCNHFAVSLQKVFGYTPYVIEQKDGRGFHAFCQVYHNGTLFYVDARGITSSFDEFMIIARNFVKGEYIIKPATHEVIEEWECDVDYNEEAYAFAEVVINKFRNYYTL